MSSVSSSSFNSGHQIMDKIGHEDEYNSGYAGESERELQLKNENLKLQIELKKLENENLKLQNEQKQHEMQMCKPEHQAAEEAKRKHEMNMMKLKNEHELAMKNKELEMLQTNLKIENQEYHRHDSQLKETRLAKQNLETMGQSRGESSEAETNRQDELESNRMWKMTKTLVRIIFLLGETLLTCAAVWSKKDYLRHSLDDVTGLYPHWRLSDHLNEQ